MVDSTGVLAAALTTSLGLVTWLVRWILKTTRATYDERVAELRAHNAETVGLLKTQIDTGKTMADALGKIEASQETTRKLVEAITPRVRDAA